MCDGRLLLLLALVVPAMGTTWVVDQANPAASDDNPGTADKPLKTLACTAAKVKPGDTVEVMPGVYREAVPLTTSGEDGAPIKYVAAEPGRAILTGADVITGWQRLPGDLPVYRVPWTHQFIINHTADGQPIEHHPESDPVWGRAEQVIVDGQQMVPTGGLADLIKAIGERPAGAVHEGKRPVPDFDDPLTWRGMFAVDTRDKKELYLWLADGSDPNEHQVEASTRADLFGRSPWGNREGVHHVELHGLTFRYAATFPQRAAIWLHGGDNLVEDCWITDMAGAGVSVSGTLRRCVIQNCGHTGGCANGSGFANEDNLWRHNSWKPISRGWDCGGVKLAWADHGTFQRCRFIGNGGPGLWLDIHVRNVDIRDCVFADNEGDGVFIEISRDNTVEHCLAVGNGVGRVPTVKGPDWSCGGIRLAESMNCRVVHNTVVGNKDGITIREQGPRPLQTDDYGTVPYHNVGHVITDNVCALNQGYQLGLWYDNAYFGPHPSERDKYADDAAWGAHLQELGDKVYDPRRAGMTIDRNLYWPGEGAKVALFGVPWRRQHVDFAELGPFVELTGFDAASRVADPRFAAATAGDYRFQAGSPALAMQAGWAEAPVLRGD